MSSWRFSVVKITSYPPPTSRKGASSGSHLVSPSTEALPVEYLLCPSMSQCVWCGSYTHCIPTMTPSEGTIVCIIRTKTKWRIVCSNTGDSDALLLSRKPSRLPHDNNKCKHLSVVHFYALNSLNALLSVDSIISMLRIPAFYKLSGFHIAFHVISRDVIPCDSMLSSFP